MAKGFSRRLGTLPGWGGLWVRAGEKGILFTLLGCCTVGISRLDTILRLKSSFRHRAKSWVLEVVECKLKFFLILFLSRKSIRTGQW
jgi:hypothetical protein